MMDNCFDNNIQLLRKKYGSVADWVLGADSSAVTWGQTREGEDNLIIENNSASVFLHSNYSASKEIDRWLKEIEWEKIREEVKVFYVYGVGAGHLYDHLLEWLEGEADRYLVFLEDDLRVLRKLMEIERGTRLVQARQVLLAYSGKSDADCEEVCEDLAYYFVKLPVKVTGLPSYQKHKEERFYDLQTRLMHKTVYLGFGSDEFLTYGWTFFQNYYHNLRMLPQAHRAGGLYGQFEGVPALICGAGPSLNKNFEILKNLDRRALIFAGGSAVNALTNRGLLPHFGATVDPNHEQYKRISTQTGFTIPFFFKGRTYHRVLPSLAGPRIFLPGNTGYPASSWIEGELGINEPLVQEGHNVLHMSIDLARMMGCNPIIFVGMDLAYTDMQLYASDVVDDPNVDEKELTAATDLNNNSFLRKDIYGKPVYTLWKWAAEANYTSQYAKTYSDTTFINATEGGLGVEGIPNMTLADVTEKHLKEEWDLRGWINTALAQCRYENLTEETVDTTLKGLQESLQRCEEWSKKLSELFEDLKKALLAKEVEKVQLLSNEIEALRLKLGQEVAQAQILDPVNHIRSILFERRTAEIGHRSDKTQEEEIAEHCDANREEMLSFKEAAYHNLKLLDEVLAGKEG